MLETYFKRLSKHTVVVLHLYRNKFNIYGFWNSILYVAFVHCTMKCMYPKYTHLTSAGIKKTVACIFMKYLVLTLYFYIAFFRIDREEVKDLRHQWKVAVHHPHRVTLLNRHGRKTVMLLWKVMSHRLPTNHGLRQERPLANHKSQARVIANHKSLARVIANHKSQARTIANHNSLVKGQLAQLKMELHKSNQGWCKNN